MFLILPVLIVIILSYYLQGLVLTRQEEITGWLSSFGPFVILIYIILQFISIVLPPLGGFFLVVVMIALYGPGLALTLGYLVATPTFLFNFYLGRKYGRPLVERLIGKATLEQIDHYIEDAGTPTLVMLRLLQGGSFDYLSYGLGLTKVPFNTFAIVNILAGIPGTFLSYFIIRSFENVTLGVIVLYGATVILAGIAIFINHFHKKKLRG